MSESEIQSAKMDGKKEVVTGVTGGNGHIRCLSSVPVDLEQLLAEIEAENKNEK